MHRWAQSKSSGFSFRQLSIAAAAGLTLGAMPAARAQVQYFTQSGTNYTYPVNLLPFSGNPSSLDFTGNTIQIAGNNSPGSFSALAGAQLKADGLSIAYGGTGALGNVTFSGAGTKVELLGGSVNRLDVGTWGTGTLTVLAGGLLDATVNAGACTGGCYNYIGNGAGSMATLNVTGAGSEVRTLRLFTVGASAVFTNPPTDFTLGEAGGETKALVNVLAGGKLSSGRATVGNNHGSPNGNGLERANGTVVVDGIGSQ
jgi:T5SS/PEP-CTERM-associated repeat protein